jgi:RimJ/RimL family protein N-acetyltransferase
LKTINTIQSDLLYLTPVTKDDADLFVEIYTDPQIMQHVGKALNYDAAITLFNQCLDHITSKQPKNLFYVIKSTHTDEKFGIIGLMWNQPNENSVELGVMIAKPYINKAYAYKATDLLIKYVFKVMNLHSIVISTYDSHLTVNRGLPSLGFINMGMKRDKLSTIKRVMWQITTERFGEINE